MTKDLVKITAKPLKTPTMDLLAWAFCAIAVGIMNFRNAEIFHRALTARDDGYYIEPLRNMDWQTYFTTWLPDRLHLAFPLRDLTFFGDFKLSELLGFQTVLIDNFAIWALTFYILSKILRLLLPKSQLVAPALLALLMLHPLNVQLIQWASMRKHLLAVLFLMMGSLHVLKIYSDPLARPITRKDLGWVIFYTLLSDLCWPNATTWPFAVIWLLRKKIVRQGVALWPFITGALLSSAIYFRLATGVSTDYARNSVKLLAWKTWIRGSDWVWRSLGRATLNSIVPFRETVYFDPHSILNTIGFFIAIALLIYFALLTFRQSRGWDLLIYAGILMLPQIFVVFSNYDFIWDDHYLYGIIPFVVVAITYFVQAGFGDGLSRSPVGRFSIILIWFVLAGSYTAYAYAQVPHWTNTLTLFEDCANREHAPNCLIETIEHRFDEQGCASAISFFDDARSIYLRDQAAETLGDNPQFEFELPLIESICTATATNYTLPQKIQMLDDLDRLYKVPFSVLFGRVLAYLSAHDFTSAWRIASTTYLDETQNLRSSESVYALLEGQTEALCLLSHGGGQNENCPALLAAFRKRVNPRLADLTRQSSPRARLGMAKTLAAWSH